MMKRLFSGFTTRITPALLCIVLSVSIQAQDIPTDPAAISAGEALFNGNCKTCHRVKQKLIGPALAGFETRVPSVKWTMDWVRNSAKVIASGDEYANKIYGEYNKSQMTAFTSFKDDQILSILAYVQVPTLLVTHDFHEAAALGDRVAILDGGRIVQSGSASQLAAQPASAFVAESTIC